jgi:hypothetical protein
MYVPILDCGDGAGSPNFFPTSDIVLGVTCTYYLRDDGSNGVAPLTFYHLLIYGHNLYISSEILRSQW